ncbi:synaptobrevin homolog 1-like [Clupea harengus]|uniref:Vesicle-associated membrane protein 7 n=1 Tax=Clupea harengus TaxID=7950 RepID=A0A8M1KFZ6_CLUHA|nr:synaptobrevin homolog 1-like [Clupea harengus]
MPVVYACITRGSIILVDLALTGGNFKDPALSLIRPLTVGPLYRRSVLKDCFRYHVLSEDGITYICATEPSFESKRAHKFLDELQSALVNSPLIKRVAFAQPYEFSADLNQMLSKQMADSGAQPSSSSKVNQMQDQVNDVKVILKDNINKVLERGERLDDLIDKTDDLQATADSFQKTSTRVARKYWWKNTKMMIIIGVIVAIIILFIILLATGVIPT